MDTQPDNSHKKKLWSANKSRSIIGRLVIEADLVLTSPTHFGNGDGNIITDMPLLVDAQDGKTPLLTGSSIAGALRGYLTTRLAGYRQKPNETQEKIMASLFGSSKEDDNGTQSVLIIDDAYGSAPEVEKRDGVRIDPKTRTAEDKKLFDMELWAVGTTFRLRFELLLIEGIDSTKAKQYLGMALEGFNNGITLGARKRRGFGRVEVKNWWVKEYNLKTNKSDLVDWLLKGDKPLSDPKVKPVSNLYQALGIEPLNQDARHYFKITATFQLQGSLMVRSGGGQDDIGPDAVHIRSRQKDGKNKPVLPGTSVAGALRARAQKIMNTICPTKTEEIVQSLFGADMDKQAEKRSKNTDKKTVFASRLIVEETVVQEPTCNLIQNRVAIDRFTGGAKETALFEEQPLFARPETEVVVELMLQTPQNGDIGLLLLLLKDLWTEDLPLGGGSSIGRGRLKGKNAKLYLVKDGQQEEWNITQSSESTLQITPDASQLEIYFNQFLACIGKGTK